MMKPVAVLQHENHMGPGSLQDCLSQIGIPMQMFWPVKGEAVPRQASEFSGIVLLGSERSALDAMPWIRAELGLCKDALAQQVPVLGLGYGAQLLNLAAGGKIKPSNSPSYGWTTSQLTPEGIARFGVAAQLEVFNAHAHSLELPAETQTILSDQRCPNKGFVLGPHLGLLCPLELSSEALQAWCAIKQSKLAQAKGPEVQNRIAMLRALPDRIGKLSALAHQLFLHWALQLEGAPRPVDAKLAA